MAWRCLMLQLFENWTSLRLKSWLKLQEDLQQERVAGKAMMKPKSLQLGRC